MRLEKSGHGTDLEAPMARATAPEWVTDIEEPTTRAMVLDWAPTGSGVAGETMSDLEETGGEGEAAHILLEVAGWKWHLAKMCS